MKKRILLLFSVVFVTFFLLQFKFKNEDENFVFYTVNTKLETIILYYKNDKGINFGSIENVKKYLKTKKQKLLFATNGGMYKKDHSPQGLFIENNVIKSKIDTLNGNGNFYLKPNGVFYLTDKNIPIICKTEDYIQNNHVKYATQSGPMLVINGEIHASFNEKSINLNIRNGVGVLPNNEVIFAMSKKEINFYDFAQFFKSKGCKNALYLDGFVSRTYCPKVNWIQTDGDFGVIIGITDNKK
ncbi:phosphodiester glycosidase family protein [Flavobacterium sp.]|uniref:phosphodiester glycosidase family protein n=1 Tax=Flavobacterium sp. TaxID=239 RepID=UPI003750897A